VRLFDGQNVFKHAPGGDVSIQDEMATRSATRFSLTLSSRSVPETYSAWLRAVRVSGLRSGSPRSWMMRAAIWSACLFFGSVLSELGRHRGPPPQLGLTPCGGRPGRLRHLRDRSNEARA
jgi:hypothetical protein